MFNFDVITNENNAERNLKWLYIPDHPYRTLITGGSGSGKANALLDLIRQQDIIANKKFQSMIKELFFRYRKFNTSVVFI